MLFTLPDTVLGLYQLHAAHPLSAIQFTPVVIAAAITACRDSDKVQVNAVRALGNMFAVQHSPSSQQPAHLQIPPSSCSSSQQPAAYTAPARHFSGSALESDTNSCGDVPCSQQHDSGQSCWWGDEWLVQGVQCLLLSLESSTDKVWFSSSTVHVSHSTYRSSPHKHCHRQ